MSDNKKALSDEALETVVGGFFHFNTNTGIMTYSHKDGSVTKHKILDAEKAYAMSNQLHAQKMPEDDILKKLKGAGYIQ